MSEPTPQVGAVALAVATDIAALAENLARYRSAYNRLHAAIGALKQREPYLALEQDLVALLEAKSG